MVLEKKLADIQSTLHTQAIFCDSERQMIEITKEINEIIEHKTRGAMLRCKANWVMAGEKPTSYFLGMEKRNKNRSVLDVLIRDNGSRATFRDDILKEESKFFIVLYTTKQHELIRPDPNYLNTKHARSLS